MKEQHQLPLAWLHLGRNGSTSGPLSACLLPAPRNAWFPGCQVLGHPFQPQGGLAWEPADFYHHVPPLLLAKVALVRLRVGTPRIPSALCPHIFLPRLPAHTSAIVPSARQATGKELGLGEARTTSSFSLLTPPSRGAWPARRAGCGLPFQVEKGREGVWGGEGRTESKGGGGQEHSGVN